AEREGDRGLRHLELHDVPQHRLPRAGRDARLALLPTRRRARDAADDGHADGARARARGPRACPLTTGPSPWTISTSGRSATTTGVRGSTPPPRGRQRARRTEARSRA